MDPEVKELYIEFKGTKTRPFLLQYMSRNFAKVTNYSSLDEQIQAFIQKLEGSKHFKQTDVNIQPIDSDRVNLSFNLQENKPFFATISQMTEPTQGASVNVKAGYRNCFGLLETTTIDYNQSLSQKKKSLNLKMDFPIFINNYVGQLGYSSENKNVYKNLSENSQMIFLQLQKGSFAFQAQNVMRFNKFGYQKDLEWEIEPSRKISTKLNFQPYNSIQRQKIFEGKSLDFNFETTVPKLLQYIYFLLAKQQFIRLGDTQFLKLEIKSIFYKKFSFLNLISQRLYENSNLENSLNMGYIQDFQKLRYNDRFYKDSMRGFRDIDNGAGNLKFLHFSTKWLFYDFPNIDSNYLFPFWHFNLLYQSDQNKFSKNDVRITGGVGLGLQAAQGIRIEVLYNMFQHGKENDQPVGFQLRLSVED